jgi:hypothetical protein
VLVLMLARRLPLVLVVLLILLMLARRLSLVLVVLEILYSCSYCCFLHSCSS